MANLYPSSSPYYITQMAPGNYLDIMTNISIPKLQDDMYWVITVTYDTRPDMLAYDLYNDPKLWWVFASRNPNALPDPLFGFTAGKGIYLPKMSTLKQSLGL